MEWGIAAGKGAGPSDRIFSEYRDLLDGNPFVGATAARPSWPVVIGVGVPEPGGLAWIALGVAGTLARRARSRHGA